MSRGHTRHVKSNEYRVYKYYATGIQSKLWPYAAKFINRCFLERLTAEANTNKLIPAIGEDKESYW